MRPKEKNSGRHRLTADATLPVRRSRLLSGHVACIVNTSNSSIAREPPCVFGYGGTAVLRSEPAVSELHALGGDASQPGWMTALARMFGTLAPVSEARSDQDDHLRTPRGSARGPVSKGPAPAVHTSGVGGRGRIKHIGSDPPGCRGNRAYIILATPDARPALCALRLGGECPDRHGGAWRTSLAHCTSSPCCLWPDRK